MSNSPNRSFDKIETADLLQLAELATHCLEVMLSRTKTGHFYSLDRALMGCLCQGAAKHYLHGGHGVHDWDVVFFFGRNPQYRFPARWIGNCDFGLSKFGKNPDDVSYTGRRIDVLGRDIVIGERASSEEAIAAYLKEGKTESARQWAKRPMIALTPLTLLGHTIWDGA